MTIRVVNVLEIVKVQRHYREGMSLALGARNLCGKALFCKAAVVQASEWVKQSKTAQDVRMALLLRELAPQTFDDELLIYHVKVKKNDKGDQPKDGLAESEFEVCFGPLQQARQREGDNRDRLYQDDENCSCPYPPISLLNAAQFVCQLPVSRFQGRCNVLHRG